MNLAQDYKNLINSKYEQIQNENNLKNINYQKIFPIKTEIKTGFVE